MESFLTYLSIIWFSLSVIHFDTQTNNMKSFLVNAADGNITAARCQPDQPKIDIWTLYNAKDDLSRGGECVS